MFIGISPIGCVATGLTDVHAILVEWIVNEGYPAPTTIQEYKVARVRMPSAQFSLLSTGVCNVFRVPFIGYLHHRKGRDWPICLKQP